MKQELVREGRNLFHVLGD